MSRSFFAHSSSHDEHPLLPQYNAPVPLRTLSPRSSSSRRGSSNSDSPPPSLYRSDRIRNSETEDRPYSLSPSPSRAKAQNRIIHFAGPPPPIASSVILPRDGLSHTRSSLSSSRNLQPNGGAKTYSRSAAAGLDPLLGLRRRETAIEKELQLLLDAQSAGLVQGLGAGGDTSSDAGSSTPTTRSDGRSPSRVAGGIVPIRQPKKKPISLRGARRGLGGNMAALIEVKGEEAQILDRELEQREIVLQQITSWNDRIEQLKGRLDGNSSNGQDRHDEDELRDFSELQAEERAVDNEIRELEDRLLQMRARKKWIGERIRESVNRREAALSSYKGALKEVEKEVRQFLERPPAKASLVLVDEEGFLSLPGSRRTLDMAREWWSKEIAQLQSRRTEIRRERKVLEEGLAMWHDSVAVVTSFENDLRRQMAGPVSQDISVLEKQITRMHEVVHHLSENVHVAETNRWNLLICAVGAELEAFKEGEVILESALNSVKGQGSQSRLVKEDTFHSADDGLNGMQELVGSNLNITPSAEHESEDEEPNLAELMVERTQDLG